MPILAQTRATADFMVSESPGYRSRDEVTVVTGANVTLSPGTILGRVTASGNYVRYAPGASDGSQTVAGILWEPIGPSTTAKRTIVSRDAEVRATGLIYSDGANDAAKATANTALRALGIIPR